jgi:uncharacterized protein (TIGR02996 family)
MLPDDFLQAILDEPGDDSVRLVAADWLAEHGNAARAEFIRLQVALARRPNDDACRAACRPPHFSGCPDRRLLQRERKLWRHHGCDWEAEVRRPVAEADVRDALRTGRRLNAGPLRQALRCEWRRGFVYAITWNCADFLRHAGALFAAQPVEYVTISDKGPSRAGVDEAAWFLLRGGTGEGPDDLPAELFDALPGGRYGRVYGGDACLFTDAPAARVALSTRCVAYGREQARKLRHARQEAR